MKSFNRFILSFIFLFILSHAHSMEQETFIFRDVKTLLFIDAVERGNIEKVRNILATGFQPHSLIIDVTQEDVAGKIISYTLTPLQIVASYSKNLAVMKELIKAGAIVNFQDGEFEGCPGHGPALLRICSDLINPNVSAYVELLLNAGAKPNVCDCNASALGYRALAGDVESVKLLLAAHALPEENVHYIMSDTGKEELLPLVTVLSREMEALDFKREFKDKVLAYEEILMLLHTEQQQIAQKAIKPVQTPALKKLRSPVDEKNSK